MSEFDVLLLVLWVITMFGGVLAIGKIQHERKLKEEREIGQEGEK